MPNLAVFVAQNVKFLTHWVKWVKDWVMSKKIIVINHNLLTHTVALTETLSWLGFDMIFWSNQSETLNLTWSSGKDREENFVRISTIDKFFSVISSKKSRHCCGKREQEETKSIFKTWSDTGMVSILLHCHWNVQKRPWISIMSRKSGRHREYRETKF